MQSSFFIFSFFPLFLFLYLSLSQSSCEFKLSSAQPTEAQLAIYRMVFVGRVFRLMVFYVTITLPLSISHGLYNHDEKNISNMAPKKKSAPSKKAAKKSPTKKAAKKSPTKKAAKGAKKKAKGDKPKRAPSAFIKFCGKHRANIMKANPNFKMGDVGKECGRLWGLLSDAQKASHK